MSPLRLATLTLLAMTAFAGNSLLCRLALGRTGIDAASFTLIRLAAGALVLLLLSRQHLRPGAGSWQGAVTLFFYAGAFSYAYLHLSTGTGALLLFGAVQITMVGGGLVSGERLGRRQWAGLALAAGGVLGLLLPGVAAPPLGGALLMLGAGVSWGLYSLLGRGAGDPTRVTAGNFLRAVPLALALCLLSADRLVLDGAGVAYALASGALASGLGYALWYAIVPTLGATRAAAVQLGVPALAALGGSLILAEPLTARLLLASAAILGGIVLVVRERRSR